MSPRLSAAQRFALETLVAQGGRGDLSFRPFTIPTVRALLRLGLVEVDRPKASTVYRYTAWGQKMHKATEYTTTVRITQAGREALSHV